MFVEQSKQKKKGLINLTQEVEQVAPEKKEVKRGRVYNRIVTPEEWEKVNPFNIEIMEDFLTECEQNQKKEGTIKQYRNDIKIIFIYVLRELKNKDITEINRKQFRNFNLYMTKTWGWSNARANRAFSALRSMLDYVENDDDYDYESNAAKKVKGLPKEEVRTNEDDFFLSFEQVMKLREELIKRNRLQDAVLLMLAFDSGARRNELYQVQKFNLDQHRVTNEVTGKRGKKFRLVYLEDTRELIAQYLKHRGEDNIDSLWYKEDKDGRSPVAQYALYDRIVFMSKMLSEIEGKDIQFFPHSLRHSRCECLLQGEDTRILDKEGKPRKFKLEEVQVLLNHTSVDVTKSYAKDHSDDILADMFGL